MHDPLQFLLAESDVAHKMLFTVAVAMVAGTGIIIVARRFGLPAIVLLLGAGMLLGPAVLGDYALVEPERLGTGLRVIVSLSVGLILFEGGLTLDLSGYRTAPRMIKRLLTGGILITWGVTALAIWAITDLGASMAILAASLVIVTGPTVIAPLLKRMRVDERLHNVLHWEGVLIDPIGVFIAVLCFEVVASGASGSDAAANLLVRITAGLGIGAATGLLMAAAMKRRLVPDDMINVFALAGAVLAFGLGELARPEAGLLSTTVAGFVLGAFGPSGVKHVRAFKAELVDLLIGTLFILLAARLTFDQFSSFGLRGALLVAIVMLVVRPLSIVVCTAGLDFTWREKLFLSWIAPRGIVAASVASIFAITMEASGRSEASFVETFVYSVIIATIVIQGSTAGWLARRLGLRRPDPVGWLVVGAHTLGCRIARFLRRTADVPVVLIDTNPRAVRAARQDGLPAITADARDASLADRDELRPIGNLLALTDNEDLNERLCATWGESFGRDHVYRCNPRGVAPDESDRESPGRLVWPRLPRPQIIAGEIDRHESRLIIARGAPTGAAQRATALIATTGQGVEVDPGAERLAEADADFVGLYLERRAGYLRRAVRRAPVGPVDADDLPGLITALVERVVDTWPHLPRDAIIADLVERETSFPTALGHGIIAPHAYCSALSERVCAVAPLTNALAIDTPDGEPVRFAILLLSPEGDPEGHLATLAELARLVMDEESRGRLLAVTTTDDLVAVVRGLS